MFYVSKIQCNLDGDKFGITDTDDNITEFYTKAEVKSIMAKIGYTSIKGAIYTGSDIKFRETSPAVEYINELPNGSCFTLVFSNSESHEYKKLSVLGTVNGWVVEKDGIKCRLLMRDILSKKAVVK